MLSPKSPWATHGMSKTPEYSAWHMMLARCGNANNKSYHSYGGRGIKVCERWKAFENFFADMGLRPSPRHSLDRYPDQSGNYEPQNCRWATVREQTNNRRSCHMVVYRGKRQSISDAAREAGMPYSTVSLRIFKGWDVEVALTTPVRPKRKNRTSPRFEEGRRRYERNRQSMESAT